MSSPPPFSVRTLAERWECSQELVRKLIREGKLERLPFSLMRISAAEVARYEGVPLTDVAPAEATAPEPAATSPAVERVIVRGSGMPYWPQAMRLRTAAAYCDLPEASFQREVLAGRMPAPFHLGGKDHWRRGAVDKALDVMTGDAAKTGEDAPYRVALRKRYSDQGGGQRDATEALALAHRLLSSGKRK